MLRATRTAGIALRSAVAAPPPAGAPDVVAPGLVAPILSCGVHRDGNPATPELTDLAATKVSDSPGSGHRRPRAARDSTAESSLRCTVGRRSASLSLATSTARTGPGSVWQPPSEFERHRAGGIDGMAQGSIPITSGERSRRREGHRAQCRRKPGGATQRRGRSRDTLLKPFRRLLRSGGVDACGTERRAAVMLDQRIRPTFDAPARPNDPEAQLCVASRAHLGEPPQRLERGAPDGGVGCLGILEALLPCVLVLAGSWEPGIAHGDAGGFVRSHVSDAAGENGSPVIYTLREVAIDKIRRRENVGVNEDQPRRLTDAPRRCARDRTLHVRCKHDPWPRLRHRCARTIVDDDEFVVGTDVSSRIRPRSRSNCASLPKNGTTMSTAGRIAAASPGQGDAELLHRGVRRYMFAVASGGFP